MRADFLDRTGEDIHLNAQLSGQFGQHRIGGVLPKECNPNDFFAALAGRVLQAGFDKSGQFHPGDTRQERPRGGMFRRDKDIMRRPMFHDAPAVDHRHMARDIAHHGHFMGDQQNRQPQIAVDVFQQRQHRLRCLRIKRRCGLIRQQNLWLGRQCAGNPNALFLPTRQLRRIAVGLLREPYAFHQFRHTRRNLGFCNPRDLQRHGDVARHRARGQQIEMLKDHAHVAANVAQGATACGADIMRAHQNTTGCRAFQPVHHAQKRGFPRSRAADNPCDRPRLDAQ